MRLGILASHPIQYQAPIFKCLAKEMDVHVYFAHKASSSDQARAGFGIDFMWDVDLFGGYSHTFLENRSQHPSVDHFFGCDTPEIKKRIKEGNFDAFLVTGWYLKSYWQAVNACREIKIPVLVRSDSQLGTSRFFLVKFVKEIFYRFLMSRFDAYLAVGRHSRDYFIHYGAKPERIFFSPHCVDNERFSAAVLLTEQARAKKRKELGISEGATLLIFSGKFIPKKRPLDLIESAAILMKKGVNVEILFVGSGELEARMRQKVEELGVKAYFMGFKSQSEIPACYAISDLLVLPSDAGETWGLVVNEAMACGLPCVVSDAVGSAPDLVDPGKTGEVYPLGNVEALSEAIQKTLLFCRSERSKEAIRNKMDIYSVETMVLGIKEAFEGFGHAQR